MLYSSDHEHEKKKKKEVMHLLFKVRHNFAAWSATCCQDNIAEAL